MSDQPDLWDWEGPPDIERRFAEFDEQHPHVWDMFVRFAFDRMALGFHRYSSDAILHRIRWETDTAADDGSGFRLNDHYTAYYARKFRRQFPQHRKFFEIRRTRSDRTKGMGIA